MANPRELAEKAFTLLQDALRDSESRATELDAELKRKRSPKNRLEQRLDVLTHRLESVEAETQKWQREAGQLEELLENERSKVQQLKKKLEVAESGPDKLTKKEINFWRQRAEHFDAETREYKKRITALKQDLKAREEFGNGYGPETSQAGAAEGDLVSALEAAREQVSALHEELAAREAELSELRELGEYQARSEQPPHDFDAARSTQQVDTLARRVESLENALAESQASRDALAAELGRLSEELSGTRHAVDEAESASSKMGDTIRERDARLVQLSAELEQARGLLNQKGGSEQSLRTEIEALRRDFAQLEASLGELRGSEQAARAEVERLQAAIAERDARIGQLSTEIEQAQGADTHKSGELERLKGEVEGQAQEIEQMRLSKQRLQNEISELLQRSEDSEGQFRAEIEGLKRALEEKQQALAEQGEALVAKERVLAEKEQAFAAKEQALAVNGQALSEKDRLLAEQGDRLAQQEAELAELRSARSELERQKAELVQEKNGVREQIEGLEAELKEEKECTENLSELANERREELGRLQERVEELEERYEEAKWRLGKAQHFERLVRRRKGLINSLIEGIRAKAKANAALKAGLDGLRTFKAAAEVQQQKLLVRIDKLTGELKDAEEAIAKYQGATVVNEQLNAANTTIAELQERHNTQIELIQTLENDLKAAKASRQVRDDHASELEGLRQELETKNEAIKRLEADVDEQQRKLAKLRGSESETVRLKAIEEKDKSLIDALQREVGQLREALARSAEGGSADGASGDMGEKLKERDSSIARLMGTVKEQEGEISKLRDSVAQWKKKYEFLSTDAPDAYQNIVEK